MRHAIGGNYSVNIYLRSHVAILLHRVNVKYINTTSPRGHPLIIQYESFKVSLLIRIFSIFCFSGACVTRIGTEPPLRRNSDFQENNA